MRALLCFLCALCVRCQCFVPVRLGEGVCARTTTPLHLHHKPRVPPLFCSFDNRWVVVVVVVVHFFRVLFFGSTKSIEPSLCTEAKVGRSREVFSPVCCVCVCVFSAGFFFVCFCVFVFLCFCVLVFCGPWSPKSNKNKKIK